MARTATKRATGLAAALEGSFAGYRVECTLTENEDSYSTGKELNVEVYFGAEKVGGGKRVMYRDGVMYHTGLGLDEEHQGKGFAQAWIRHSFEQYRRFGVKRVEVRSGATHVWGRLGFVWSDASSPELLESLTAAIAKVAGTCGASAELDALTDALAGGTAPMATEIAASATGVEVLRHVIASMTHQF